MLKDLAAAFDAYVELSANLQEGTKVCLCLFYMIQHFWVSNKRPPARLLIFNPLAKFPTN